MAVYNITRISERLITMIYDIKIKNDSITSEPVVIIRFPQEELDKKALYTIEADCPPFVIPFRHKIVDGQIECTYRIGDRSKLKYRYGRRDVNTYIELWESILQPVINCSDWFLKPSSFVFDTNWLYLDKDSKIIRYIYVPSVRDCAAPDTLKIMMQELAKEISVEDLDVENRVLRAFVHEFRPVEFLKMLRESKQVPKALKVMEKPVGIIETEKKTYSEDKYASVENVSENGDISINEINLGNDRDNNDIDGEIEINIRSGFVDKFKGILSGKKNNNEDNNTEKGSKRGRTKKINEENELKAGAIDKDVFRFQNNNITPETGYKAEITESPDTWIDDMVGFRLISGSPLPKSIPVVIEPGGVFTIGRFDVNVGVKQSDFEFDGKTPAVSRHHAAIERNMDGSYSLIDDNSSGGTYLDGIKLVPNNPYPLLRGSKVSFGTSGADYIWEE